MARKEGSKMTIVDESELIALSCRFCNLRINDCNLSDNQRRMMDSIRTTFSDIHDEQKYMEDISDIHTICSNCLFGKKRKRWWHWSK